MGDDDQNSQKVTKLEDVLDGIDASSDGEDGLSVADIMEAFGSRSFGPLLAALGLIALSPLGAIPGVPAFIGLLVILVAGQRVIGMKHAWIPSKIKNRSVSEDKWESAREKARPWAKRVDRFIGPRLTFLTHGVMDRGMAVLAIVLAILMVPLELLPFAVMVPAAALLMFGLAMSARDGVLALAGILFTVGSLALVWKVV